MSNQLHQVEQFMLNTGQTVRYQPTNQLKAFESLQKLEQVHNKFLELCSACGIDVPSHLSMRTTVKAPVVSPEMLLLRITELHYLVLNLYHVFGLGKYADGAFTEVHNSNLTRIWEDGKIHKSDAGTILKPLTYQAPDMVKILNHYNPPLFANHKPLSETTHLDDACDMCQ